MSSTVRLQATPYKPSSGEGSGGLPIQFANYPFQFVHYPQGWEYVEGYGFLPSLSEIVAKPGVNGVGLDLATNKADSGAMKKGGTIIKPGDRRLGADADYVISYPVVNNNRHFCFKGTRFQSLPGGSYLPVPDPALLHAFRKLLVDTGIVDQIPDAVYQKLLEMENKGYARILKQGVPAEIEKKAARIEAMKAAYAALGTAPTAVNADAPPPAELAPQVETKRIRAAGKEGADAR